MTRISAMANAFESREVKLSGGRGLMVRPLRDAEYLRVQRVYPAPIPPMEVNPRMGSASAPVPNEADPAYQLKARERQSDVIRAEVVIAAGLMTEDGRTWESEKGKDDALVKAFFERAKEELSLHLTLEERMALHAASVKAADVTEAMLEKALGELVAGPNGGPCEAHEPDSRLWSLPDSYLISEFGLLMRAAERYGQHPLTFPDTLSPHGRAMILAQERIRQAEERRDRPRAEA